MLEGGAPASEGRSFDCSEEDGLGIAGGLGIEGGLGTATGGTGGCGGLDPHEVRSTSVRTTGRLKSTLFIGPLRLYLVFGCSQVDAYIALCLITGCFVHGKIP